MRAPGEPEARQTFAAPKVLTPAWYHRVLKRGDIGGDVRVIRRKLGLPDGNVMDDETVARVRGAFGSLTVDANIADALGEAAAVDAGLLPLWFSRPLRLGDEGGDVTAARHQLGLDEGRVFDQEMDDAVRRVQSNARTAPNGTIGEEEAQILGDL